mmetsp:Transcript_9669/g.19498  ORF Transcript_9669/g.19498 Transcript_9669/m.19498 type:complete len:216 (-) Transcript_9669:309-956(-)
MHGVLPALRIHLRRQQPVRLHHDLWVGGLHGEEEVMVVVLAADARELESALHHALRGVSEVAQSARRQRPVIRPDPHRNVVLLALEDQRRERLLDVVQLGLVRGLVVVVLLLEALAAVGEVARIDPNLVKRVRNLHGDLRGKVDVRDKRRLVPLLEEAVFDLLARVCLPLPLHRQTHQIRPCVGAAHDLVDAPLHVRRHRSRHRLQRDRMVAADF